MPLTAKQTAAAESVKVNRLTAVKELAAALADASNSQITEAAEAAGVSERTLRQWIRQFEG